jgi:hypothetical protein
VASGDAGPVRLYLDGAYLAVAMQQEADEDAAAEHGREHAQSGAPR